ncbi:MAG TPA: CocE/NonD family hydrolase [Stellaceae bacterium]|nr:CocE/NonD family hydrolase [Stellaceae bacterium]
MAMKKGFIGTMAAIGLAVLMAWSQARAAEGEAPPTKIVTIKMRDGTPIVAALYMPAKPGNYPALLAASPYRFDNNGLPAVPMFLWRETGPIGWYVQHGFVYVHMDVRGSGRSGGVYRYFDAAEQHDLYDVIEWIAKQPWSNGKVGGIGQSYYAMSQWFMGAENPPHLACIAPYDGLVDTYHNSSYQGGIPSPFFPDWYDGVRVDNREPFTGPSREMPYDLGQEMRKHATYDSFWRERSALERLGNIKVPVFSIGLWSKVNLHLDGNMIGFERASGPKKLMLYGGATLYDAVGDYASPEFHEKYLLPFYNWCLKGEQTDYVTAPPVRYFLRGANEMKSADAWPPSGFEPERFYLAKGPSGSVTSLNDGALGTNAPQGDDKVSYQYPNEGWRLGVVGFDKNGRPDPARRVLTFTSPPLPSDLTVVGPIEVTLYGSSSRSDMDMIVNVDDQHPQSDEDRQKGIQPQATNVSKGWLKASMRHIDPAYSSEDAPWYDATKPEPITPGKVYKFEIRVVAAAYVFKKGDRIRLDVANGDSPLTDGPFAHDYTPDMVGTDTFYFSKDYPSNLALPVANKITAMAK